MTNEITISDKDGVVRIPVFGVDTDGVGTGELPTGTTYEVQPAEDTALVDARGGDGLFLNADGATKTGVTHVRFVATLPDGTALPEFTATVNVVPGTPVGVGGFGDPIRVE